MFLPTSHKTFWLAFAYLSSYLELFNGKWHIEPCLP